MQNTTPDSLVIAPIRVAYGSVVLYYNDTTKEVTFQSSSRKTKNSIDVLIADTAKVYELVPKTYIYNTDPQSGTHVGYIAEDVADVDPRFATYNELNGPPVAISYDTIQVYMLEEMKKLRDRIAVLESGGVPTPPSGDASVCSTNTPLSSGEEAAPAAPAEEPAAPADAPAAPADAPAAPAE